MKNLVVTIFVTFICFYYATATNLRARDLQRRNEYCFKLPGSSGRKGNMTVRIRTLENAFYDMLRSLGSNNVYPGTCTDGEIEHNPILEHSEPFCKTYGGRHLDITAPEYLRGFLTKVANADADYCTRPDGSVEITLAEHDTKIVDSGKTCENGDDCNTRRDCRDNSRCKVRDGNTVTMTSGSVTKCKNGDACITRRNCSDGSRCKVRDN